MAKELDPKTHEYFCSRINDERAELVVLYHLKASDGDPGQTKHVPIDVIECSEMDRCGVLRRDGFIDWSICPGYKLHMPDRPADGHYAFRCNFGWIDSKEEDDGDLAKDPVNDIVFDDLQYERLED